LRHELGLHACPVHVKILKIDYEYNELACLCRKIRIAVSEIASVFVPGTFFFCVCEAIGTAATRGLFASLG
jgi:hypothetical protein